jgi:hypothetical protein
MSVVLTGNSANVTTPLISTVNAMTSGGSGTIRVQTTAPHLYGQLDQVLVLAGSVDATFPISVIDATHFDCIGSTFVSGGSGVAIDMSLTPAVQIPSDGDTFSAQLSGLLSAFQALLDRSQYLQKQAAGVASTVLTAANPAENWQPVKALTSPFAGGIPQCAGYDAVNDRWMVGFGGSGSFAVSMTDGLASSLVELGITAWTASPALPTALLKDPSDATTFYAATVQAGGSSCGIFLADSSVGSPAWSPVTSDGGGGFTDDKTVAFSGKLIEFIGGASLSFHARYSTNKWGAATIAYTASHPVSFWSVKTGPNEMLALPVGHVVSVPFVTRSTDGAAYTEIAIGLSSGIQNVNDVLVDVANLGGSVWLMAVSSAVAGCYFLKSSNGGLTWGRVSVVTSRALSGLSGFSQPQLCAFGNVVACLTVNNGASIQSIMYSIDGGVTWRASIQSHMVGGASQYGVTQSATQMFGYNAAEVQLSYASGLPSTVLT